MKYKIINIDKIVDIKEDTFYIRATQEYLPSSNIGHYKYVIMEHLYGAILKVGYSTCSAPEGKINQKMLARLVKEFYVDYKQYQKYLKEQENEKE